MKYPTAAEDYADRLQRLAGEIRNVLKDDEQAAMLEQVSRDVAATVREDEELLLTERQAVAYTRGYTTDYLRRLVPNRGTANQRLYRKGDLPRKAANGRSCSVVRRENGRIRYGEDDE